MKLGLLNAGAGVIGLIMIFFLGGCKNEDKNPVTDPDAIYFDYRITGREGDDKLTILLQYRVGDEEGDAIRIPGAGKVELDGQPFQKDSAAISGFFYELHLPTDSFAGPHQVRFTDQQNRTFTEEFLWTEPRLVSGPMDTIGTEDLLFEFSGLDSVDRMRIMVTDTSFINNELNQSFLVRNNKLRIPIQRLHSLSPGPVQVEFILDKGRPLKSGNPGGGRFQVYYSLIREYWLKGK